MNTSGPALFSALFILLTDFSASLRIRSHNEATLNVSVIHDSVNGLHSIDLAGNATTDAITVQDNETLVVLVRRDSSLIATAILEINVSLAETIGAIATPINMVNTVLDQCEFGVLDRATQRSIEITMAQRSAQSLVLTQEVQALWLPL